MFNVQFVFSQFTGTEVPVVLDVAASLYDHTIPTHQRGPTLRLVRLSRCPPCQQSSHSATTQQVARNAGKVCLLIVQSYGRHTMAQPCRRFEIMVWVEVDLWFHATCTASPRKTSCAGQHQACNSQLQTRYQSTQGCVGCCRLTIV